MRGVTRCVFYKGVTRCVFYSATPLHVIKPMKRLLSLEREERGKRMDLTVMPFRRGIDRF